MKVIFPSLLGCVIDLYLMCDIGIMGPTISRLDKGKKSFPSLPVSRTLLLPNIESLDEVVGPHEAYTAWTHTISKVSRAVRLFSL